MMPLYYLTEDPEKTIQGRFESARNLLVIFFKLELTLPQLWKLRNVYCRRAIDNLYSIERQKNAVKPAQEAAIWFIYDEFGIPPYYEPLLREIRNPSPYEPGKNPLKELLRRRQEETEFSLGEYTS